MLATANPAAGQPTLGLGADKPVTSLPLFGSLYFSCLPWPSCNCERGRRNFQHLMQGSPHSLVLRAAPACAASSPEPNEHLRTELRWLGEQRERRQRCSGLAAGRGAAHHGRAAPAVADRQEHRAQRGGRERQGKLRMCLTKSGAWGHTSQPGAASVDSGSTFRRAVNARQAQAGSAWMRCTEGPLVKERRALSGRRRTWWRGSCGARFCSSD